MAQRRKTIRVIQRGYHILNRRGKAHLPTPPLYTIDKAPCNRRGTLPELAPIPTLPPIPTLLLISTLPLTPTLPLILLSLRQAPSRQAPTTAIPLPILAVNWERIKKFRSILQAKCIETCSCYKER